ncbi:MAG: RNA-processing protein [Candidatus Aenigmatarchaeota archaeon]
MIDEILVPNDRIGIFNRAVIESIEKESGTKLERRDNIILISGEGLEAYQTALVVKAIGRGFAPVRAMKIFEGMQLEVIKLDDRSANRIKSRIIGTAGKARRRLEYLSDCAVSVYGNTVSLIGPPEKIINAKKAVEMIIKGSTHNTAYLFLERQGNA